MLIRQVWHFEPATQSIRPGFWLLDASGSHLVFKVCSKLQLIENVRQLSSMRLVTGSLSNLQSWPESREMKLHALPISRAPMHSHTLKVPHSGVQIAANMCSLVGIFLTEASWSWRASGISSSSISRDRQKTARINRMKCIQ